MGRGRPVLRILQITLTAAGGMLIVPTAVNIGTGGDPPGWMRPLVPWLWPVAIGCVVLVIVLEAVDRLLPAAREKAIKHRVGDPRNVPLALVQVTRYVSARQRGSLAERVRVALALDEQPAQVRQPAHLVARVSGTAFTLSTDLGIADVFTQMNESMLILGAPGAGKTTQLLDLAARLAEQARDAGEPFVPVVLDLADWARPRSRGFGLLRAGTDEPPAFDRWVVQAMWQRYLITEEIGTAWLRDNRVVLLLDGLDEVAEGDRARCVAEINALQDRLGVTRVAVCSREADYDRVGAQLQLQGAVTIRPLTRGQVADFLVAADPSTAGMLAGLDSDDELWDVLTTPLMLSITVLANTEGSAPAFAGSTDPATRRRLLFDAYVVEVLSRRRAAGEAGSERALRALRTLAEGARLTDAGVRVVAFDDDSAYTMLPKPALGVVEVYLLPIGAAAAVGCCTTVMAALTGFTATLLPALISLSILLLLIAAIAATSLVPPGAPVVVRRGPVVGYAAAVLAAAVGLAVGLPAVVALAGRTPAVVAGCAFGLALLGTVVTWWLERPYGDGASFGLLAVMVGVGVLVAVAVLLFGYTPDAGRGWALGVVVMSGILPLFGVLGSIPEAEAGTGRLDGRVWIFPAVFVVATAVAVGLITGSVHGPFWVPTVGWLVGVLYGIPPAMYLLTVVSAPVARVAMAAAGEPSPWRRAFLRFAADRGLLTYADGEYLFVHLLVRDHLAACEPAVLAAQVARRKAELATPAPSAPDPVA